MKNNLWFKSSNVSHEESLDQMALSIFEKISRLLNKVCLWGYTDLTIQLSDIKLFSYIPLDLHENVKTRLYVLFVERGLSITKVSSSEWNISWKPSPSEARVPRLTSRDLVQAGYNPAHGSLFHDILHELKGAILKGEVSNDTLQANLIWVKQNFPI